METPGNPDMPTLQPLAGSDYRLDQIVAVPTWHAVFWNGTEHIKQRVYLLALATNTVANEPGLLVGLMYTPGPGWQVADITTAFCGLLPPDWDLKPFEASNPCGHVPPGVP